MRTILMTADLIPLRPIKTEDAVTDIIQKKAYSLKDHPTKKFRSTSGFEVPAPIAIAAFRHVTMPGHFYGPAKLTNENLFIRDGNQCAYCGTNADLTRDHIVPVSFGGKNNWKNVVSACGKCNRMKGNILHTINADNHYVWEVFDTKSGDMVEMIMSKLPKVPSKIDISRRKTSRKFGNFNL